MQPAYNRLVYALDKLIFSDFQSNDAQCFQNRLLICMGPGFQLDRVADCGAGIGRVTRHLLLPRSAHVDLVEQSPRLLNAAPQYMASGNGLEFNPDSVTYLNLGLQVCTIATTEIDTSVSKSY